MTAQKGVLTQPAAVALGVITLLGSAAGAGYKFRASQADEKVTEQQVEALTKNIAALNQTLASTAETVGKLNERLARLEGTVQARFATEAR